MQKKTQQSWWWPVLTALLLVGLAVLVYLLWPKPATAPTTTTQGSENVKNKETLPPPSTPMPSDVKSITITQLRQQGDTVEITGEVTGPSDGTCVAEFTAPDTSRVAVEGAITTTNGKTTCGPIRIPAVEFSYLGEWQAVLKVYTKDQPVASPAKTITIN